MVLLGCKKAKLVDILNKLSKALYICTQKE